MSSEYEQLESDADAEAFPESHPTLPDGFLARLRAYFMTMPETRLAYFQEGPASRQLSLTEPDQARVVLIFTRNVSSEHIDKRLGKISKHFAGLIPEPMEFQDIERLEHREACEVAFNAQPIYGSLEAVERDRLYRYSVFLEWNASKRISGIKQDTPPVLTTAIDRPLWVISVPRFVAPIYRHLKMIEAHVRELERLTRLEINVFTADTTNKSLAESYMLKSVQSAILITMSVMHRKMKLSARDYRDLFLHLPVFGITTRERAAKLVTCAEIRDRLMFQYDEVTDIEVFDDAVQIIDTLRDFKTFMLDWLFENYYAPTGELIQTE